MSRTIWGELQEPPELPAARTDVCCQSRAMSIFLTDEELFLLTGRRRAKAQADFLRSRHIRHFVNRAGRVVVVREWLTADRQKPIDEPNFAALKAMA